MSSASRFTFDNARRAAGPGLLLLATVVFVIIAACQPSKRLTKANVDQVQEGMAKKQVESILGVPTSVDTKDYVVMKKTTYVYRQGNDSITIVFKEDKVESKESTLTQ
jgi:outer membrane protein assembly factor BamE (lipoprotein component of BamABCDE complex)